MLKSNHKQAGIFIFVRVSLILLSERGIWRNEPTQKWDCSMSVVHNTLYKMGRLFGPRQNLSSRFPTKRGPNQSPQLQRLVKTIEFRQVSAC